MNTTPCCSPLTAAALPLPAAGPGRRLLGWWRGLRVRAGADEFESLAGLDPRALRDIGWCGAARWRAEDPGRPAPRLPDFW